MGIQKPMRLFREQLCGFYSYLPNSNSSIKPHCGVSLNSLLQLNSVLATAQYFMIFSVVQFFHKRLLNLSVSLSYGS